MKSKGDTASLVEGARDATEVLQGTGRGFTIRQDSEVRNNKKYVVCVAVQGHKECLLN